MKSDLEPGFVEIHAELPPGVLRATLVPNRTLPFEPAWDFRTLNLGTDRASPDYDAYIAATVGSTCDFGDEMRFGKADHVLLNVLFSVPDRNVDDPDRCVAAWLAAPRVPALPRLEEPALFNLEAADVRAMDTAGEALLSVLEPGARPSGQPLRVTIASDTDLLFVDRRFCGWLLLNPLRHLRAHGEASAGSSGETVALVHEYLSLVAYPHIERMEDRDPEMQRTLLDLARRADERAAQDPAARALALQARDIVRTFYGENAAA